jgi:hypothetical protein
MEWVVVGNAPLKETIPATPTDQDSPAREIAEVFARQLTRHFGPPPAGVRIVVERIGDRASTLYWVTCYYDPTDDPGFEYAWRWSKSAPEQWDEVARQELAALRL